MANPKVALQLYTLREEMQKDFVGTLQAVARMGYPAVQLDALSNIRGPVIWCSEMP